MFCFLFSNTNAQMIGGVLVDDEDKAIENEEIIIEVQICKNGDSLFTKKDTVMTKDYGIFSTDLTEEFKANPVTKKDKVEYSIKYTYRGDTIETDKAELTSVQFANEASNAEHANESDHALIADHAMVADGLTGLDQTVPDGAAGIVIGENNGGTFSFNSAPIPNDMGFQFLNNTPSGMTLQPVPPPLDQGIILIKNNGSGFQTEMVELPPTGENLNVSLTSSGGITFSEDALANAYNASSEEGIQLINNSSSGVTLEPVPTPIVSGILLLNNTGSELIIETAEIPIIEYRYLNINTTGGGGITFSEDHFADALNTSSGNPGIKDVFVRNDGTVELTENRLENLFTHTWTEDMHDNSLIGVGNNGNGQPSLTFFQNRVNNLLNNYNSENNGSLIGVGEDTNGDPFVRFVKEIINSSGSSFINFVPNDSYGAMTNRAVCADGFFPFSSPLLPDLETQKSNNSLATNNSFWTSSNEKNTLDFIENIKIKYPQLVRQVNFSDYGHEGKKEAVDMMALIPLLSKSLAEQSEIIDQQQKQIDDLKILVNDLIKASAK
jgi:hypothetical protein